MSSDQLALLGQINKVKYDIAEAQAVIDQARVMCHDPIFKRELDIAQLRLNIDLQMVELLEAEIAGRN